MTPLVSIIVPVYNEAAHLREAVDSVLAQTVADWELLLVDDGSTDGSDAICDEYESANPRIRALHQPNRGLANARNAGLAAARGKWIAFLDGDDCLPEYALETYLRHAEGADAVVAAFESWPGQIPVRATETPLFFEAFSDMEKDFVRLYFNLMTCVTMLVRAEIVQRFDESIPYCGDVAFVMEQLAAAHGIRVLPDVLYRYRIEPETTLSNRFYLDHTYSGKRIFETVCGHFPGNTEIRRFMAGRYALLTVKYLRALCAIERLSAEEKRVFIHLVLSDELRRDPIWTPDLIAADDAFRPLWETVLTGDASAVYDACIATLPPAVSIIVPVYNEAAYLSETVDSVLAQTAEHWELLLVDDGSTDGSDAICERLAAQDKRIRVLHTEHRGVSAARNAALAATRGKWVQFLDADDLLDARCLETLLRHSSGFERVCCGFRWYPDGRACVPCARETALNSPAEIETADAYFPLLSVVWSGLFRRSALACRFDESISIGEDILFNADWFDTPRAVRLLPDVLYCYRVSPPPPPRIGDLQALETIFRRIKEVYGNAPQLVRRFTANIIEICVRWFLLVAKQAGLDDRQKRLLIASQLDNELFDGRIPSHPGGAYQTQWATLLSRDADQILAAFRG